MHMAKVGSLAGACPWHDAATPALYRAVGGGAQSWRRAVRVGPEADGSFTGIGPQPPALPCPALSPQGRLTFLLSLRSVSGEGEGGRPD